MLMNGILYFYDSKYLTFVFMTFPIIGLWKAIISHNCCYVIVKEWWR